MKRILPLFLALALMLALAVPALASTPEAENAANTLYQYGLFKGTGTDADGKPIFDLDKTLNRQEAVALLVRILGKEAEAQQTPQPTPFTDVDDWAKPYVGYAYAYGLTDGTSDTTFGGNEPVSASQYVTFVLRALGYTSAADFQWDRPWELSDRIGLTDGRYTANPAAFTRGDAAIVSLSALDVYAPGSGKKLGVLLGVTEPGPADTLIDHIRANGDTMGGVLYHLSMYRERPSAEIDRIDQSIIFDPHTVSGGTFPAGLMTFSTRLSLRDGSACRIAFVYDIAAKKAVSNAVGVSFEPCGYCWNDPDPSAMTSGQSYSFDIASYTPATELSFDRASYESSSMPFERYAQAAGQYVKAAMAEWESLLEGVVGISLGDLGFMSYSSEN